MKKLLIATTVTAALLSLLMGVRGRRWLPIAAWGTLGWVLGGFPIWIFNLQTGGSTLRDHRQADGALGYFQHRFAVYDREGERCPRNDGGIIRRTVHAGRSTFYCPACQR